MTASTNWRDFIQKNLYALLAAVVIAVVVLALLLFAATSLIPALNLRGELGAQLAQSQQDLADAHQVQAEPPGSLQTKIAAAQTTLTESASAFLTDAQGANIITTLYQYALDSGVTIVSLENRSDPNQVATQVYRVITFNLQAQGSSHQLIGFVQRIKEASIPSIVIDNLNIADGPALDTLSMAIAMYVSSYSSGAAAPSAAPVLPLPVPTLAAPPLTTEQQLAQRLDPLWAAQNWPEVISLLEQLRAINPNYPNLTEKLYAAHVNLGHQLAAAGKIEEARAEFNDALAVNPTGGEASLALSQLTSGAPTPAASPTLYSVQAGDTLFSISRRYGVTVDALRAANGLTNNSIRVGQQLIIPTP
jgi:LysM repeat protein/Tfp pilus assembly protein PilO